MSFFLFKKQPSLSFIFDIRDTSISLAAVRFVKEKKPEIVLCQNFSLNTTGSKDNKKYLDLMIKTLDQAILSVRQSLIKIGNKENIEKYYFFIGSPWSISQAKTIKIIKDKPFEITNKILSQILVGEESEIEKDIEDTTSEKNLKILEEKIIQSKLNGYKVEDIYGKKTLDLAVELFVTFIPSEIKDRINFNLNEKIGKNAQKLNHSCILSSYSYLRDLYSDRNDFIYADIGKLLTDIYVVRDDIIFAIASIPFGEENILQVSLNRTKLPKDVFLSNISIAEDKNFDLPANNNNTESLRLGLNFWKNKFKEALPKICTEMNIPNNLFIIPNSKIADVLIRDLSVDAKNGKIEILGTKIDVHTITENIINSFIDNSKTFFNEPYVKMDTIFVNKLLNK